jgi:hypothetical protein
MVPWSDAIWPFSCHAFARGERRLHGFAKKRGGVTNVSGHDSGWGDSGLPAEFPVLLAAHPNVLIVASEETHEAAVKALMPYLRQPVTVLPSPSESALPSSGSVILRSIGDLNLQAQEALFYWLEGRGKNTQVVSLSPVRIFPLVTSGRFLASLYYRINVVQFDAGETL